jgi:ArsR family transcriptional regulator
LITTRRVGRQVYCSLNTNSFELCIQGLERLMDPANSLESFPLDPALLEAEVSFEDQ